MAAMTRSAAFTPSLRPACILTLWKCLVRSLGSAAPATCVQPFRSELESQKNEEEEEEEELTRNDLLIATEEPSNLLKDKPLESRFSHLAILILFSSTSSPLFLRKKIPHESRRTPEAAQVHILAGRIVDLDMRGNVEEQEQEERAAEEELAVQTDGLIATTMVTSLTSPPPLPPPPTTPPPPSPSTPQGTALASAHTQTRDRPFVRADG